MKQITLALFTIIALISTNAYAGYGWDHDDKKLEHRVNKRMDERVDAINRYTQAEFTRNETLMQMMLDRIIELEIQVCEMKNLNDCQFDQEPVDVPQWRKQ